MFGVTPRRRVSINVAASRVAEGNPPGSRILRCRRGGVSQRQWVDAALYLPEQARGLLPRLCEPNAISAFAGAAQTRLAHLAAIHSVPKHPEASAGLLDQKIKAVAVAISSGLRRS